MPSSDALKSMFARIQHTQARPMTMDHLLQVADQHHRAGRRREAETTCRQVLAGSRITRWRCISCGILEAQVGHLDSAVLLISRAVQLRPDFAEAWANLGCVLVNHRKLDEAIAVYHRLTQLRPTDGGPHYALGILWGELGRVDEAIAAFSRATQHQPDLADAHARLGAALRSQGRFDEAIAAYSRAMAIRPDWADARNNLANVTQGQGFAGRGNCPIYQGDRAEMRRWRDSVQSRQCTLSEGAALARRWRRTNGRVQAQARLFRGAQHDGLGPVKLGATTRPYWLIAVPWHCARTMPVPTRRWDLPCCTNRISRRGRELSQGPGPGSQFSIRLERSGHGVAVFGPVRGGFGLLPSGGRDQS